MAVYDTLPSQNLKFDDIRDTLNSNGGAVTNVVATAFQEGAKINVWSKHKPVIYSKTFCQDFNQSAINYDANWWKAEDGNCGLNPKVLNNFSEVVENTDGEMNGWVYKIPNGTNLQPRRVGDFAGYYSKAEPPIYNMRVTPSQVASGSSTGVSISSSVRVGTDTQRLTFADFPNLKDYYFGVYCVGKSRGYIARATSNSIISTGNASVDISTSKLVEDTYSVYPFLAEKQVSQTDANEFMTLYTLPNLKVQEFKIVNEAELYYVTVRASISDNKVSWTVSFTVQEGGTTKTFTTVQVKCRFPGKGFDEALSFGETNEWYDINIHVQPGQTVVAGTGTTTIISDELLKDCAVWGQVSNGSEKYRNNIYIHN